MARTLQMFGITVLVDDNKEAAFADKLDRLEQVGDQLEVAFANWATLSAANKDLATRRTVGAAAAVIDLMTRRL